MDLWLNRYFKNTVEELNYYLGDLGWSTVMDKLNTLPKMEEEIRTCCPTCGHSATDPKIKETLKIMTPIMKLFQRHMYLTSNPWNIQTLVMTYYILLYMQYDYVFNLLNKIDDSDAEHAWMKRFVLQFKSIPFKYSKYDDKPHEFFKMACDKYIEKYGMNNMYTFDKYDACY